MKNNIPLKTAVLLLIAALAFHRAPADEPQPQPIVKDGQKVAFLGDSITAQGWANPGGYVRLVVDGLAHEGIKVTPIPAGVGGNTSADMLARLDASVLEKQPDWMTLSCGVNDVWHGDKGVPLDAYKQNITAIVDRAQAKGIKVMVLTSTPIGEEDNANNKKLAAYNDFLRQLAKERKLPLADLSADFHAVLAPMTRTAASRNLTVDGVHMNPEGNVLMAKGVLRAFGVTDAGLEKIENAWLAEPGLASIPIPSAQPDISLTLGEYRGLVKGARKENADIVTFCQKLWFKAAKEVLESEQPNFDGAAVKKKIDNRTREEIAALAKE